MIDKEYNSEYIKKIVTMLKKHEEEMKYMSITK